jgi:hypothetical protein
MGPIYLGPGWVWVTLVILGIIGLAATIIGLGVGIAYLISHLQWIP